MNPILSDLKHAVRKLENFLQLIVDGTEKLKKLDATSEERDVNAMIHVLRKVSDVFVTVNTAQISEAIGDTSAPLTIMSCFS